MTCVEIIQKDKAQESAIDLTHNEDHSHHNHDAPPHPSRNDLTDHNVAQRDRRPEDEPEAETQKNHLLKRIGQALPQNKQESSHARVQQRSLPTQLVSEEGAEYCAHYDPNEVGAS